MPTHFETTVWSRHNVCIFPFWQLQTHIASAETGMSNTAMAKRKAFMFSACPEIEARP